MKTIVIVLGVLLLSGCGIHKLAEDTRDEVKKSNDNMQVMIKGMDTTNGGVHLQILQGALKDMFDSKNTESLEVPALMMPGAKTFAKEATAHEVIEFVHVLVSDMTKGVGEELTDSSLRIRSRQISMIAAGLIAAFTPEEKAEEILHTEIVEGGVYKDSAYVFALLRHEATKKYRLDPILGSKSATLESLKTAVGYFRTMKSIVAKPYFGKLVVTIPKYVVTRDATSGMITAAADLEVAIDAEASAAKGRTAQRYFKSKLAKETTVTSEVQSLLNELAN